MTILFARHQLPRRFIQQAVLVYVRFTIVATGASVSARLDFFGRPVGRGLSGAEFRLHCRPAREGGVEASGATYAWYPAHRPVRQPELTFDALQERAYEGVRSARKRTSAEGVGFSILLQSNVQGPDRYTQI
jgi:hypothetical protein